MVSLSKLNHFTLINIGQLEATLLQVTPTLQQGFKAYTHLSTAGVVIISRLTSTLTGTLGM